MRRPLWSGLAIAVLASAQETLPARAQRYCADLIRIDTSNPPGHESAAAAYVKRELEKDGIAAELLGDEVARKSLRNRDWRGCRGRGQLIGPVARQPVPRRGQRNANENQRKAEASP